MAKYDTEKWTNINLQLSVGDKKRLEVICEGAVRNKANMLRYLIREEYNNFHKPTVQFDQKQD